MKLLCGCITLDPRSDHLIRSQYYPIYKGEEMFRILPLGERIVIMLHCTDDDDDGGGWMVRVHLGGEEIVHDHDGHQQFTSHSVTFTSAEISLKLSQAIRVITSPFGILLMMMTRMMA